MRTFHQQLKYQRELRGWSQARMAEEIGTTPNRISSWERGIALPSAFFREKLCARLDMNAQELGLLPAKTIEDEESFDLLYQTTVYQTSIEQEPPNARFSPLSQRLSRVIERPLSTNKRTVILTSLVLAILLTGSLLIANLAGAFNGIANPYAPYTGRLVLNNTLQKQDESTNWQEGANESGASCMFKYDEYVAFQPQAGFFHACLAQKTDYKNFAYEVGMTIHSGDFGGLVFRGENGVDGHYYLFRQHIDSSYSFYRFTDHSISHAVLLDQGYTQTFKKGAGKLNLLAVVAQNETITIYVNQKAVTSIRDTGYTHGQIGVLAGTLLAGPAETSFKNAKVWAW